ncbi:MAG: hypothetical protein PHF21_03910, partial [Bacilli bacterium]|nr:hypothetical protein [Bacilli bacterium]
SEVYWEMANKIQLKAIDDAYNNVLIDKKIGKNSSPLVNLTYDQIKEYFHKEKLVQYNKISTNLSSGITDKINKHIKKNIGYAKALGLNIPDKDKLTVYQYYYNYLLLKKVIPTLESKVSKNK